MSFVFAEEVRSALDEGRPVVALESTVIAHGLPRPQNLETAKRLESIVRENGAVPATIAIIDGDVRIGLNEEELTLIAERDDIEKMSIRDLARVAAYGKHGATTVASTVHLASRAGIKVFATGGIGGVHRGFEADVSADLTTLGKNRMIVVCAGAKSVLDLERTRERLETDGVPVLGWKTERFPAFYKRDSGLMCDSKVESTSEIAEIWKKQLALGIETALLVTVPIPTDDEIDPGLHDRTLGDLLWQANEQGVQGKEITPFLLQGMAKLTEGATLSANISLLENNVRIASEIAIAIG